MNKAVYVERPPSAYSRMVDSNGRWDMSLPGLAGPIAFSLLTQLSKSALSNGFSVLSAQKNHSSIGRRLSSRRFSLYAQMVTRNPPNASSR